MQSARQCLGAFLFSCLATLFIAAQTKSNPSPDILYDRCKASVVTILTFDANRAPLGQGSGFIVSKNRVVTNYHVVAGSTSASVIFNDGSMTAVAAVVAASEAKDLAILEVETANRASVVLGDELGLKVGETIYAIGTPNGLSASLSNGLVSAFRQDEGQFLIQITAPIARGSSGGPLLNSQGQVVGVTTSRMKDGSFGFAVGAGDVQHLLKVPLTVKLQLSDLRSENTGISTETELSAVQALFDEKKYDAARTSFDSVSETLKTSFEGELLLCKIEKEKKEYSLAIHACDAAIHAQPKVAEPYGLNAYSFFASGDLEQAELAASKAAELSADVQYKHLLAAIHYTQEKYDLAAKELPADPDDSFLLTLLTGAALHNQDYNSFYRLRSRLSTVKGNSNGWELYTEGVAAEKDLNWESALDKYKKCDADGDFIDPICLLAVVRVETRRGNFSGAKTVMDDAISHYPTNHDVLSEGIFVTLLLGNVSEADQLHSRLGATDPHPKDEFTDCLYYYARNQPRLATSHCEAAIKGRETEYSVWSNAGYVALDNRDFQTAFAYFAKALQLFYDSKEKHTVTQELDVCWGMIVAEYYSGERKKATTLYRAVKKQYPEFIRTGSLKQLPLVWSDYTIKLIDSVTADLK